MNRIFTALLFCFITVLSLQAQDVITKRSGEKLEAKVLEITLNEIKYKAFNNLEGPLYTIPKQEVLLIHYANNTTETFELNEATASTSNVISNKTEASTLSPTDLYHKGRTDAKTYYTDYKTAGTVVLVSSLLNPLLALVPAIATSTTTPKAHNFDTPDYQMMNKPDYIAGYKKGAKKVKSGKVWKNWGIGLGVNFALILLVSSQQ